MKVDSIASLKLLVPKMEAELQLKRREIFAYAFKISRAPNSKTLDLESAKILVRLFLGEKGHAQSFVEWLSVQNSYRALNMDQIVNFYDFATAGIADDLSNFDEEECWPCMIDEFVEWRKAEQSTRADGA